MIIKSQTQNQVEENNSSAQTELTRKKTNTKVSLSYTGFVSSSGHASIALPRKEKKSLLSYLALSVWNTWFNLDTFSVTHLPLTNPLRNIENRSFCLLAIISWEEKSYMWPRDCPAEIPAPSPIYKMYKRLSLKSSSLISLLIEKYTVIICQNLFAFWTKTLHVFLILLPHHFTGLVLPSCPVQKYKIFVLVIEKTHKTITHLISPGLCPCLELKKWHFTGILWTQHPVWTGQSSRSECTTCKKRSATPGASTASEGTDAVWPYSTECGFSETANTKSQTGVKWHHCAFFVVASC